MSYSRLPDTPWHMGYPKMHGDRRHRSRCIYFDKATKYCTTAKSPYIGVKCGGSAHCRAYAEIMTEEIKKEDKKIVQNIQRKKINHTIVDINDVITVKDLVTGEKRKFKMLKGKKGKVIPISQICVGKSKGYVFPFRGTEYKIMKIENDI